MSDAAALAEAANETMVTHWTIAQVAADLISTGSQPNIEYDRALVEMTTILLGMSHEEQDDVEEFLLALALLKGKS
jgi:hypothetical protein